MKLTPAVKKQIDSMSYYNMLYKNRFCPIGDKLFEGESGEYFLKLMSIRRSEPGGNEIHVAASKEMGWK